MIISYWDLQSLGHFEKKGEVEDIYIFLVTSFAAADVKHSKHP